MTDTPWNMSSQAFERDVIEYFAPLYGFDLDDVWGIVTHSGTDGNNHGIYFGANYLKNKTQLAPVVYVSDEAHYSNMRLAHLQNLEMKLIKSDAMGRMIPEELEKALDVTRPVLIVYAMGSTFKGAIDDMETLNAILDRHTEIPAVYRHVDAALFGGYLPFTEHRQMVSHKAMRFESIAISGHKFFGIDSPSGLFLCTRNVYDNQEDFNITYLNSNMRMINCSRDARVLPSPPGRNHCQIHPGEGIRRALWRRAGPRRGDAACDKGEDRPLHQRAEEYCHSHTVCPPRLSKPKRRSVENDERRAGRDTHRCQQAEYRWNLHEMTTTPRLTLNATFLLNDILKKSLEAEP